MSSLSDFSGVCRVNDAVDLCAQEAVEEAKKSGKNVSKEETTTIQWRRATNIIHMMAAIIYKRLFR